MSPGLTVLSFNYRIETFCLLTVVFKAAIREKGFYLGGKLNFSTLPVIQDGLFDCGAVLLCFYRIIYEYCFVFFIIYSK